MIMMVRHRGGGSKASRGELLVRKVKALHQIPPSGCHSMMTVDSVHATIKRATQKKTVYAPSEWITIISNARYDPFPYNVIKLNHLDFCDWKMVGDRINLTLNGGVKLKILEVRRAIFDKKDIQNNMQFKFISRASDPKKETVIIKQKRRQDFKEPTVKYCNPLPIATKKYQDLMDLCAKHAIPDYYHKEYSNLQHSNITRDALPEPDEEELVDELDL